MPRSPKVKRLSEFQAIELLAKQLGARGPGVDLGIGDDAALLRQVSGKLVLSVDTCLEHTHFEREWLSLEQLGARALHGAASDLAAMGARARAVLCALVLPPSITASELKALAKGQARAAKHIDATVVGGNITRGRDLSLTTTVIGSARHALGRKGARVGDQLWLVGELGLASAGLWLLQHGQAKTRVVGAKRCLDAWRAPRALVSEGLALGRVASAAIDISDGLGQDAGHLARASGRRVVIEQRALEKTLCRELSAVSQRFGFDALALALSGGEDYALLATGDSRRRPRGARPIGRIERGEGVVLETLAREQIQIARGYDHLLS